MRIRSKAKFSLLALAFLGIVLVMVHQASAGIITWDGEAGDGLWATANNWSTNALPATTDTAALSNGDTIAVSAATIDALTSAGSGGIINGVLTVTKKVTNDAGSLVINGTASSKYNGGVIVNGGSLEIHNFSTVAGATTSIASGAGLTLNFDAAASAKTWGGTAVGQITGSGTLNTKGLVRLNSNSKTSFTGTTNVLTGTLYLGSGGTEGGVGGTLNIANGASVEINTGTPTARNQTTANNIISHGTLSKINNGTETLTGNSVFYGDTQVEGPLAIAGSLQLDIANGGICSNFTQYWRATDANHPAGPWISAIGNVAFNGALKLDVTDVSDITGSWVLVDADLTKSFGDSFTLAFSNGDTFSENGNNGVWTGVSGGKSWSFTESTATLTIVPEPSSIVLLTLGLFGFAAYVRRRS
jgi:fibronectin-binding autotransporter adhesin